jgi:hypothetical protein
MSVVINLPTGLESKLNAEAARIGLPLPEYILRLLEKDRASKGTPRSGAELLAYWQTEGVIGTRPDIADASAHARALRDQAQQRMRS